MASSYVNDLRLNEMATGDASGTWGTTTNTNLELIAEAFSYGTEAITTNADTHTTTIADGATDPGRSMYLKYTGTLDSACTITIGPNTVSKVWIVENGTSGSQDIILSQGSGANITIPAGDTKVVYSDGAGAGAAFFDAFASLSVVDLKVQDDLTVTGDIDVDGTTNLDVVDIDGALTQDGGAVFNEASADVDFRVESDNDANALFVQGSDGYVGIGTSGPAAKLHATGTFGTTLTSGVRLDGLGTTTNNVAPIAFYNQSSNWGTQHAANIAAANADGTDGGAYLRFSTSADGNTAPAERMRIPNDSSGIYAITSNNERAGGIANASSAQNALRVWADPDDERSSSRIEFYVDVGEAMRIESSHRVLMGGTTNPTSSQLFVAGGAGGAAEFTGTGIAKLYFGSTEGGGQTWSFQTSGSGNYGSGNGDMYIVNGSATTFMQFDTSASTVVGDFVDTSDVGLKENIVDTTDGLTKLMQLQPRKFDWKKEGKQQQVNGFIAQELETVLPNEVSGNDYDEENPYHGCKAINTSGILSVAVKAIQEQQALIESLTARITTLEG
jgi:hypothetical protein